MKALLPIDSPKYLRRLVRALNAEAMTGNGFYVSEPDVVIRSNRARLSGECIEARAIAGHWFTPGGLSFCDCNGREIVASRQP